MGGINRNITLVGIWVTAVTSGMAINGATPLCFELAVESAFPVSTSFVIMLCTTAMNACTLAMIFVPVASAATAFNWAYVAGCTAATATLWIFYREQSKRFDFDSSTKDTCHQRGASLVKNEDSGASSLNSKL